MYEREFKSVINKLPSAFMLYGACRLSLFLNLEIIKKQNLNNNILILRESDYKLNKACEFLGESSLFFSSKLLILQMDKAISNKDLKEILKFVSDDSKLILSFYESSALKDLEKTLNNNFVRFFEKKTSFEQIELLKEVSRFFNITINEEALIYLQKNYEFDIYKAGCELLKYKNQTVDLVTLKEHLDDDNFLSFDDFFNNFLITKSPNELIYKITENEDEIAIINKFYANFLRLFKISANLKINGKIDYKVTFGYTPPIQVCKDLERQARLVSSKFEEIFAVLLNADYELKTNPSELSKEIIYSHLLKLYFLINS